MTVIENCCVGCPTELGCLGDACPHMNVEVKYCDSCGSDCARYTINGEDFCEECAASYVTEMFLEMTVDEQAALLGLDFSTI